MTGVSGVVPANPFLFLIGNFPKPTTKPQQITGAEMIRARAARLLLVCGCGRSQIGTPTQGYWGGTPLIAHSLPPVSNCVPEKRPRFSMRWVQKFFAKFFYDCDRSSGHWGVDCAVNVSVWHFTESGRGLFVAAREATGLSSRI
jgi:hypothetical protein